MLTSLVSLTVFATSTYALAFNGARPTVVAEGGDLVFPPKPTSPPKFNMDLLKRQNVQTDLIAPDNTCGYISGLPGAAYYCNPDTDSCAFFPSTSGTMGFVGCCNTDNCGARLTCIDSSQYYSETICDNGCQKDTFTLKCTAASAPYCNGIRWPNEGVQDYFCDFTLVTTWQTAFTTYNDEAATRSFSPLTVTLTTTGTNSVGSTSDVVPVINTDSASGSATDSTSSASAGIGSSRISSGSSSASSTVPASGAATTTAAATSTKKKSNTGAIAGGVVGGVAALAAVGVAIWFFLRHKRKTAPVVDASGGGPPPSYAPQNDAAYAAAAVGKPGETAQQQQYNGVYAPQGQQVQQGYAPVPQQQQYVPPQQPMAEAPGNSAYLSQNQGHNLAAGAAGGAAAAYDPQSPHSQNSQPLSPNSASHLSAGYPDRAETTSPMSQHRVSTVDGHNSIQGSPQPGYQLYAPYQNQPPQQVPQEMSGTNAGPWPTNLHEGTYEAPGSEAAPPRAAQ